MSRLTWTEWSDGWQSGRYQIELMGPQLWVLSSRDSRPNRGIFEGSQRIEATSGSLRALKAKAGDLERGRRNHHRIRLWLVVLTLAVTGLSLSSLFPGSWSPLVMVVSASAGFFALLGVVDGLVGRSWESLSSTYQ